MLRARRAPSTVPARLPVSLISLRPNHVIHTTPRVLAKVTTNAHPRSGKTPIEGDDGCCSASTRRTRSRSRARRSCRFDLFGAAAAASLGGSGTGAGAAVTGAAAGAAFSSTLMTSGCSGSGSEDGAAAFSSADGWTRTPWDDSSSLRESPFFNSTGTSAGFGSIEGSAAAGFDVGSSTGFSSSAGGFAAAGPSSATSDALRAPSFLDVAHPMIVRRFSVFFLVECVCAVGAGWGVQWPFSTPLELLVLPVV